MTIHAPSQGRRALSFLLSHVRTLLLASAFIFTATQAHAQGCVIARGGGGAMINDGSGLLEAKHWQLNFAYRHFTSDRHFIGPWEQPQRKAQDTQVINNSHFFDITITYAWTKRLNLNMTIPYVVHDRSSKYELVPFEGAEAWPKIREYTLMLAEVFRPFDYGRFEFRFDGATGEINLLEVNLQCNLWSKKVYGRSAELRGWSQEDLIESIVAQSLRRHKLD